MGEKKGSGVMSRVMWKGRLLSNSTCEFKGRENKTKEKLKRSTGVR